MPCGKFPMRRAMRLRGDVLRLCTDIPLQKVVAGVRVGLLEGRGFVLNPSEQELQESSLDLMLAGTADALLMIEGYCDFLSEEQMLEVTDFGPADHELSMMSMEEMPAHCIIWIKVTVLFAVSHLSLEGCTDESHLSLHECYKGHGAKVLWVRMLISTSWRDLSAYLHAS